MKVLFTTNTPASYRVDFFNKLGTMCDLTVLFETQYDKSRDKKWSSSNYQNFKAVFLKGIRRGEADGICFSILKYLNKNYDAIIIGAYHTPTARIAIEYLKLRNIPFYISSDGGFIKKENKLKYWIKKHYISSASAWLSTGKLTTDYLIHYGANSEKIWQYPFSSIKEMDILPNLMGDKEKQYLRQKLGMEEEYIFVSVGQFIYRKGYDILLEACKDINKTIGVYIIGGTPTDEYLQLQNKYQLSNVHFVGFKDKSELSKYYKAADMFVLPTREDIWGLVINEAMGYGLPVITTDRCIAGLELVKQNENGFIIPVESVESLKEAMEKIEIIDLEQYSLRALQTARKYTIEKMALSHKAFLEGGKINGATY